MMSINEKKYKVDNVFRLSDGKTILSVVDDQNEIDNSRGCSWLIAVNGNVLIQLDIVNELILKGKTKRMSSRAFEIKADVNELIGADFQQNEVTLESVT